MVLFAFLSSFKHNTFIIREKEQKNFCPCNDPNDLLPAIFHGRFGIRFWFLRKPDNRSFTLLMLFLILFDVLRIQSTLGFTTTGLTVDLALATGRAVTDLQNVIHNGLKPILLLATTWSLYQAEIHLI